MFRHVAVALSAILCLSGCTYQFGDGGLASRYRTLSVPFVTGDSDGDLTAILVEEITRAGAYEYVSGGGALILEVEIIDLDDENIGFRYDRKNSGRHTRYIIPTETRVIITAQVALVEACSGNPVLGPVRIDANVDFDHDFYKCRNGVNVFSLGQLSDYYEAYDAMYRPLYRALAQKIVDYISDSW